MTSRITTMMPICHMYKVTQILLLSVVLALLPLSVQAKIYLLSVGISDYPGTRNDLRLPHNDAATMQWLYKENKQAKVCLLMNDKAKVATVKKALQKMVSVATADDIVVIFFSGHGVKGGFVCYDDFLYYDDIYTAMASCKSKNKMVFADACFAGAIRQGKSNANASSNSVNKGNVMFFLSRRQKQLNKYATDAKELQLKTFRHLIRRGIKTLWGKEHDYAHIETYEQFRQNVHVNTYEELKKYIHQMREGKENILWPGVVRWYAKSSGTTNDKSQSRCLRPPRRQVDDLLGQCLRPLWRRLSGALPSELPSRLRPPQELLDLVPDGAEKG